MKKHILMMALAAAAFAACEKPVAYEPGVPMDLDGPNVYFSNDNAIDHVLPSDVNTIEVEICREDATDALTLPLIASCGADGAFVVPETVEFASGEKSAVITVSTGEKFEMFKEYVLTLSVPEEYTHAYKPQDVAPNLMLTILQEDYVPYAKGMYLCEFCEAMLGWPAWEQILEYSAITDTFRFSGLWNKPTLYMTFQWDKAETVTVSGSFPIGLSAGYGMISAIPIEGEYDSTAQTLKILVEMYDSSTWGEFYQTFTITEFFE